ncbi:syntaxin-1A-like [Ochlerotatus camptorhynchus]|uniref:syntaxin-1A-like n=1 Tax=Ochlerotatus camptorhynchus TaxID=644619 RepID=UPI0031DB1F15
MTKDRLEELLEKSEFKDFEYKFVQEHEFITLHNQEQILEDLDRFSEIANWIRDLQRNILDIEVHLFCEGLIKASQKLKDNANLCYRIFGAVKGLQMEQDSKWDVRRKYCGKVERDEDLVSRVRSTQFESIKMAYIAVYWKYNAMVHRYEDTIRKSGSIVPFHVDPDQFTYYDASDPLLLDGIQYRRISLADQTLQKFSSVEEEARHTLNVTEERHQDLLTLERSLVEMRDLFVLFSTLVMEHGSLLNLVEGNIEVASVHVAKAAEDLKQARQLQWRVAKRKCFCLSRTALLVAVLGLLVVIAICVTIQKLLF